jgi:diguanylate cyclase (GGDEF)-like protein
MGGSPPTDPPPDLVAAARRSEELLAALPGVARAVVLVARGERLIRPATGDLDAGLPLGVDSPADRAYRTGRFVDAASPGEAGAEFGLRPRPHRFIPLGPGAVTVGVAALERSPGRRGPQPAHRAILEASWMMHHALEVERLTAESAAQMEGYTALAEVGAQLHAATSIDGVLRRVVMILTERLQYRYAAFGVITPDGRELQAYPLHRGTNRRAEMRVLPRGTGRAWEAIQRRRPIVVADTQRDPVNVRVFDEVRCEVIVPISYGGESLGALGVGSHEPNSLGEREVRLLKALAAHLGTALVNLRLFRELAGRIREVTAFHRVAHSATGVSGLGPVLQAVLDELAKIERAHEAAVFLLDGDRLVAEAARGPALSRMLGEPIPVATSLTGEAIVTGQPLLVDDMTKHAKAWAIPGQKPDQLLRSAIVAPMREAGDTLGALYVGSRNLAAFTPPDLHFLSAMAGEAAAFLRVVQLRERLAVEARTDPLTGLANRRHLNKVLEAEVNRSRRSGYPISLVTVDLDGLKAINDRFGHHAGDEAIVALATALQTAARTSDLAARLGGEEFCVLLPDTDETGARAAADRILQVLRATRCSFGHATASIGVATLRGREADAELLLRRSDHAMYKAKERGRNRVEPFA